MANLAPPPLPREHGAWTMLAIPMLLGLAAGGVRSGAAWLVPVATCLVYLAHHAIVPWAQRMREGKASPPGYASRRLAWGAAYLTAAAVVFTGAVFAAAPPARGPFLTIAGTASVLAAVYAVASMFGYPRSLVAETLGMAGLALGGSMVAAGSGRPLDRSLFGTAAIALGYFLSSVAFVRAYDLLRTEPRIAIRACLVAHVALAAALAGAAEVGVLPRWWWIAFVPVAARTVWGLASPPRNLRALGMREIAVALSFTILAGAVLAGHA